MRRRSLVLWVAVLASLAMLLSLALSLWSTPARAAELSITSAPSQAVSLAAPVAPVNTDMTSLSTTGSVTSISTAALPANATLPNQTHHGATVNPVMLLVLGVVGLAAMAGSRIVRIEPKKVARGLVLRLVDVLGLVKKAWEGQQIQPRRQVFG